MAAHELRTPTQAILGYIELLETDISDGRIKNNLDSVVRNANRLAKLVEDLLDVSRIESHHLALHKEKTNLENIIDFIIKDFNIDSLKGNEDTKSKSHDNYKKNIEIFFSKDIDENENLSPASSVVIDRSKITQVISNLINNSINSIHNDKGDSNVDGNRISITITKIMNKDDVSESDRNNNRPSFSKEELLVTIKDSGKGIDPKLLARLYEKFATSSSSGTGLGLYISKAIIEAHGGRIWAENNKNGKGATFRFTLPLM